jgi:hypothetical protein
MEAPVEIRYSGVILGRIDEMPNAGEMAPFFLPMREPLPVGTVLHLRLEDRETPVRVVRTVESPDPDVAGMHVRAIGESDVVAFEFIPAPVPMLDPPRSEPATPVVEIDAQKSAPEESVTAAAPAEAAVAETGVAQAAQAAQAVIDEQAQATSTLAAGSEASVAVEATSSAATATEAVPEAVPTAVGSSLTGALANATDSVASESAVVSSEAAGDSSTSSGTASTEDLPPARPISGSNGRRKTKRRK